MISKARRRGTGTVVRALVGLSAGALCACSSADPPYAELPLRDALTADPEVMASMPLEARRALAERFEEARLAQADRVPVTEETAAPFNLVRDLDDLRAARGDDALVAAAIKGSSGTRTFEPFSTRLHRDAPRSLPPFSGGDGAPTASLEASALRGHAGVLVEELVRSSGAKRLIRVTAWPVGAAAVGDAVYVNASWLVALSPDTPVALQSAPIAPVTPAPVLRPLALHGNPYLGYGSLLACTDDVTQRCATCLGGGECDDQATLHDLGDGRAECTFLSQDANRPAELCALALLSIDAVAECVSARAPSCALRAVDAVSSALPQADAFLAEPLCTEALDECLSGSTSVPHKNGCQDPFKSSTDACDTSCKTGSCTGNSGDSCSSNSSCNSNAGNSGCNSCNSASKSSSSSCSSCKGQSGGSSGGSGNCKCQTPAPPESPLPMLAWLLSPLGYALFRARRRS